MAREISRRHILLPITFFWVFFGVASVQPYVVPYLRDKFAISEVSAVTVIASVYLILGICRFFACHVIRLLGKKATILLGVCGYVLFPVILLFGSGFATGMAGAAALGVGGALLWTASSAQVLDVSEKDAYGRAAGVLQFFTLTGIVFGTLLYDFLLGRGDSAYGQAILHAANRICHALGGARDLGSSYVTVFATAGLLGIVAIASACMIPRVQTRIVPPSFGEMMGFVASRERLFAPVVLMIQFSTYGIMLTLTNQYVKAQLGDAYVGKVHACYLGSGVAVSYLAGVISDRIGRKWTLFGCFAFAASGMLLFSTAHHFFAFAIAAVLLGVVFGGVPPVALAYVGDISTPENRPSVHAFIFAWRDFGLVAVSFLRLLLSTRVSPRTCFLVLAGVFVGVSAWMFFSARAERRPASVSSP